MLTTVAILDELLDAHAAVLGPDFTAYRNHTYRVLNLCIIQSSGDPEQLEKSAIAAAFHDIGIWTDGTFDYLQPSVMLATNYLVQSGRARWTPEISAMILAHHKISRYGVIRPGWSNPFAAQTGRMSPVGSSASDYHGIFCIRSSLDGRAQAFTSNLVQLELTQLRAHPLNPLPMVRL